MQQNMMNGILVMDKPQDFTSFDVIAKLRGICSTRKIGHSGTLDPMATGVLPVFIGGAAKAVDLQPRHDKTYEATLLFGVATDTGDITGSVIEKDDQAHIDAGELQALLPKFIGQQQQLPPMYSAIKVNGKPLYKYAREGKTVERKMREITVHSIQYLEDCGENRHTIWVHCSKGTYIRTLAEDIGKALGTFATLAALRRTSAGVFDEGEAYTFEQVQQAKEEGRLADLLLPVEKVFMHLPLIQLDEAAVRRLTNGAPVYGIRQPAGQYRVQGPAGFVGLATLRQSGELKVDKLFLNPAQSTKQE